MGALMVCSGNAAGWFSFHLLEIDGHRSSNLMKDNGKPLIEAVRCVFHRVQKDMNSCLQITEVSK